MLYYPFSGKFKCWETEIRKFKRGKGQLYVLSEMWHGKTKGGSVLWWVWNRVE